MATMRKLTLVILCTAAGGLLFCGASAQAATGRDLIGSFGPGGPGTGVFEEPQSIAVEQTTGDIYVYDIGDEGRVYKFNAEGEPEKFSSSGTNVIKNVGGKEKESEIAVDSSSGTDKGDIYIATGKEVSIYSSTGEKLATLLTSKTNAEKPCGVAVGTSGAVYIAFHEGQVYPINMYTPVSTNPITTTDYTSSLFGLTNVCSIAVDAAGDFYYSAFGDGFVSEYRAVDFNTTGKLASYLWEIAEENGGGDRALAVDPSAEGDLYVDEKSSVSEYEVYDPSDIERPVNSGLIGEFGKSGPGALSKDDSHGVAVSESSGDVYVAAGKEGEVEIFGPRTVALEPITNEATSIARTTATLNGSINPEGLPVTSCEFEYDNGHAIACAQTTPIEGSTSVSVSANPPGLTPGTLYAYRLVVGTGNGSIYHGLEKSFLTRPAVEGVVTAAASEVLSTSATLNGSLEPNGFDTHYFFEYGESRLLGFTTAREDAGEQLSGVEQVPPVSVTGLEPNKTYYFQLVAENSFDTTKGSQFEQREFTTIAIKPVIHTLAAGVTSTTAGLIDTLNPENSETKYHFVYGSTEGYGQSTSEVTLASSFGEVTVSGGVISELQPGAPLYYRLIATNQAGTSEGPPQTLTTNPGTPPTAITAGASAVSQNTATISGTVGTNGLQTSYGFEIGTEAGDYGPATGLGSLGGATTQTVTLTLGELQPGTTYYYRVTATNRNGTSDGEPETFTTPGFPILLTAPSAPPLVATPAITFPAGSQENTGTTTETKKLTNAQKLSKALKACKKETKSKRTQCEKSAKKKYPSSKKRKTGK
jgi:hypothetical protein